MPRQKKGADLYFAILIEWACAYLGGLLNESVPFSENKVDQLPNQQVVGADGRPIPVYSEKPNGPYAIQEFPSTQIAHGFPDIVDNYADSATKFSLNNGSSLYQASGSYNGVEGRFGKKWGRIYFSLDE